MRLKDKILKYKIEILVIGVVCCMLLPLHIYYKMTHFDENELVWNQPFEHPDSVSFISNDGTVIRAYVNGTLHNRPTWARLRSNFNLNGPSYYIASIYGAYVFPDSTQFYNTIIINKPICDETGEADDTYYYITFANRITDINTDSLQLSNIQINGVAIPDAFYINKSNSKNTYGKRYKKLYRLVDEILWSKPLGLVYFKTADSTEYYRSDVFYDIPIDRSSPR
ncbi:MAG: hypothetical protein HDS72_07895 [Bacteroidales bacterium]|nr:hypothetical protein [Bacteroidales bacterium]